MAASRRRVDELLEEIESLEDPDGENPYPCLMDWIATFETEARSHYGEESSTFTEIKGLIDQVEKNSTSGLAWSRLKEHARTLRNELMEESLIRSMSGLERAVRRWFPDGDMVVTDSRDVEAREGSAVVTVRDRVSALLDRIKKDGYSGTVPKATFIGWAREIVALVRARCGEDTQEFRDASRLAASLGRSARGVSQWDQLVGILEALHGDLQMTTPDRIRSGKSDTVFIGHGRSMVWRDLKDFLHDRLKLPWDEFNREPTAGYTTKERLEEMLDQATFAFLVMTAEDEQTDGTRRARENVVHEVGLFQGRLSFRRAIILLEEGCEEFSNIVGIVQIRFPKGNISAKFEEIRRVLEREEVIGG